VHYVFSTGLAPFYHLDILNPAAAGYCPAAFSLQSCERLRRKPKIGHVGAAMDTLRTARSTKAVLRI
jgi:hypothetical protein